MMEVVKLSPDIRSHYQQLLKELSVCANLGGTLWIVGSSGIRRSCSILVLAAASPFLVPWLLDGGDCVLLPDMEGDWVDIFCYTLLHCPQETSTDEIRGLLEMTSIFEVDLGLRWGEETEVTGSKEGFPAVDYGSPNVSPKLSGEKREGSNIRDELLDERVTNIDIISLEHGPDFTGESKSVSALTDGEEEDHQFCCNFCLAKFVTYTDLELHMACHKIEADFNCDDCQQNFDTLDQLSKHCREIHGNMECSETGEFEFLMEGSDCVYSLGQDTKLEKKFQCSQCFKNFTTKVQLKHHMNIHLGLRPYTCTVCGKGFTQPTHLKIHKRTHDGSKPYMCSVCGKTFAIASNMRKHLAIHDRESVEEPPNSPNIQDATVLTETNFEVPDFVPMTNHPCRHCQTTFNTKRELLTHLAGHAEINPFHCLVQECDARFPSQKKLAIHERKLHGKQHTCSYCGRVCVSSSQLEKHVLTHTGEKPHNCDQCGKAFTQKSHVTHHINTVHGDGGQREKKHVCQECGKGFVSKAVLLKHSMLHTNERPFQCTFCPKTFVQKSHLKVHISKHTGDRPFLCLECGKSFTTKQHLKEHNKLHTGSKPWYECSQCDAKYRGQADLTIHMRLHTGETPFSCDQCDKSFRSERSLENHARIHTGSKPFQCGTCNKCFTTPSGLRQHFKHNLRCQSLARPGSFSTKPEVSNTISLAGLSMVAEPQIMVEETSHMNLSSVSLDLKHVGITDLKQIMRLDLKEIEPVNLTDVDKVTSYA